MHFFDAHLDLAYLAECGRDMLSADLATCGGKHAPAAVTFPSLREGRVTACLGTIFTEAIPDPSDPKADTGPYTYPLGDAEAAFRAGMRQLKQYHRWLRDGVIELLPKRSAGATGGLPARANGHDASLAEPATDAGPEEALRQRSGSNNPESSKGGMLAALSKHAFPAGRSASTHGCAEPQPCHQSPLQIGILMECADPIRTPDELHLWANQGVIAVGLAWVHGSRYAAGNGADPANNAGLTDLGREFIPAMDSLGIVHDLSHLSQRATDQLLELTDAPVIASHSNCRALCDRDPYPNARQRHLADATIAEIARRGGMIGLNLVSAFLDQDVPKDQSAPLGALVRHANHIASLVGHTRCIGLGSDMDGGFSAERLPAGIRRPADLSKVAAALHAEGWSRADVDGFTSAHWTRFWHGPVQR
jgi:microsomal dipeptidase-like Zn-dependent dipeptidase